MHFVVVPRIVFNMKRFARSFFFFFIDFAETHLLIDGTGLLFRKVEVEDGAGTTVGGPWNIVMEEEIQRLLGLDRRPQVRTES